MPDGDNKRANISGAVSGSQRESTNFKYVSWAGIAKAFSLPTNTNFTGN
ncbi:hypothetical protein [Colwellia piezophila]|nr:hypothetical protein [Colwellia piezophila]